MSRVRLFAVVLSAFYVMATWGYRVSVVGEISYEGDFRARYGAVMLTDTIEFYNFNKRAGNDWLHEVLTGNVKNYLGPILLIRLMGGVPYGDLIVNTLLILCSAFVLVWLLEYLNIHSLWPIIILLCNPEVFIYSQGFNKEIPLVFCAMLFAFSIARGSVGFSLLAIALTLMFRTQIAFFFALFFLFELFYTKGKKNGLFPWLLSVPIAFVFPFLYGRFAHLFLEFGDFIYASSTGSGVGQLVTQGLMRIPFFAYIGLPIHAVQNMLEPVLGLRLGSITALLPLVSVIMVTPFFLILLGQVILNILSGKLNKKRYHSVAIHLMVVLGILFVAINPFIHSRYLFCFLPLLPLAIKKTRILVLLRGDGGQGDGLPVMDSHNP